MNVIMLAAGKSNILINKYPSILTEIGSKPFIYYQLDFLKKFDKLNIFIVINKKIEEQFYLSQIVKQIEPKATILTVNNFTKGALFSSLLCVDKINYEEDLLVLNCNEYLDIDSVSYIKDWNNRSADMGLITFQSVHPRYSYVKRDDFKEIMEIEFNRAPTKEACTGLIWIKNTMTFVDTCSKLILKSTNFEKEFYFNELVNQFILNGLKVIGDEIDPNKYFPLKSDEHLIKLNKELTWNEKI